MNTSQMQYFLLLCGLNSLFCKLLTEHKTGMVTLESRMHHCYPCQHISSLYRPFLCFYNDCCGEICNVEACFLHFYIVAHNETRKTLFAQYYCFFMSQY